MFEGFEHLQVQTSDPECAINLRYGDFPMDTADFEARRKIECPALILWAEKSHTQHEFDAREAWPHYCANISRFRMLPYAHYPMEEAPHLTYRELDEFFKS